MVSTLLRCVLTFLAFAFAAVADTDDEWLAFPSRHGAVFIHKDCVHRFDDDFHVDTSDSGGDILRDGDHQQELPPCPHLPRWSSSMQEGSAVEVGRPQYYSDWVGYGVTTGDFGFMSSDWVVPAAPKSTGPVPGLSSVYFFNGLEDGGGVHGKSSYILQPVLSYGAGRAYCGKRLSVKEGDTVRGIMQLGSDQKSWTTSSIRLHDNATSTQTTNLGEKQPNAAYATLETMINYGCKTFPPNGSLTFKSNVLKDRAGKSITPSWKPLLRHTECKEQVQFGSDGAVTISWDSKASESSIAV